MKRTKKTARRLAPSSSRVQGLRRELLQDYYTKFPAKCKPNLDGRGGFLMMSGWALVFMTIGVGWAVAQLFRVIDWLEG